MWPLNNKEKNRELKRKQLQQKENQRAETQAQIKELRQDETRCAACAWSVYYHYRSCNATQINHFYQDCRNDKTVNTDKMNLFTLKCPLFVKRE